MKRRVAIAGTLGNDPAIPLMDEPFGALHADTRWQMQQLLLDMLESSRMTREKGRHADGANGPPVAVVAEELGSRRR